ncbi:protein kinase family protein / peptidoglycan-binding LysM domain-containing protein [Perilla frutescens var. hirtella]|nr:protein kinase family protein / peptidoglycan-binding LysM domain-containing protein [Perilla frutescens var. frutescens]KAH6800481.1 protein kinase family protein / peptidoglycan-binding LysM domain-containing protein [Perilla frutescens var. hirtella]
MGRRKASILIVLHVLLKFQVFIAAENPTPLNCTDTSRLCTSFLAFKPSPQQNLPVILSMFDVLQEDITIEGNGRDYVFIKKNCSCALGLNEYLTNTTFTVRENNGSVFGLVRDSYGGLAYFPSNFTRAAKKGAVVSLRLMCGCSSGLWNYLMSYVMQDGDSVESLASRFGVSMDSIETINGIADPDNVTVGALYYIPLNSVPGEAYPVKNDTIPVPAPAPSIDNVVGDQVNKNSHVPYWWIIGSLAVGLALIIVVALLFVFLRSSGCCRGSEGSQAKDSDGKISHKFHILRNTSFCCASGRSICGKSADWNRPNGESSNRHMNIPTVIGTDVFEVEKPVVFTYEEIVSVTDGFSDSNLLGHGTYGSVYYGLLQDQEVAIKKMTTTKTKEFMAEMKVLCKVHHTNLVELIGYTGSGEELFLIYEYAQKGSLRNHLHDPQSKGHTSLSWIIRVQIALDTARGLEYIHEHTKPHYVHRDIKTSNILLDGSFRAKISDFGLAKLVATANDAEESVTRVVGTYGYLAPEYLRDGLATTKSDVYAFGVVLFEMVSGKEAMTRSAERRSLVSIMVAALRNSPDSMTMSSMKDHVDPNLMDLYPHDCLFKVAMLAKQCVDDDPILRPDMKQVVISLSQILLSSIEWEATLAGNSQVFSGLVQGR